MSVFNLQQTLALFLIVFLFLHSFYKKVDWLKLFILLKTLHLFISLVLLNEVIIYNSNNVLVPILYILSVSVLKSVLSILLIIISQNKNNTLSF